MLRIPFTWAVEMLRVLALALSLYSPRPDFDDSVLLWQHELGLLRWNVRVEVVGRAELEDGTLGDVDADARTHIAVIRILRENDYRVGRRAARADQKLTIAHEMMHLRRLESGDPDWQEENGTVALTFSALQVRGRWRELLVAER
jgi:hypothetical protein